MAAGNGKRCPSCFWLASFEARRAGLLDTMDNADAKMAMGRFTRWLCDRRGAHFAALNMHRYQPFLEAIYRQWKAAPTYADLVSHFGAQALRRSLSIVRWMEDESMLVNDADLRAQLIEQRRIQQALRFFDDGMAKAALLRFYDEMISRAVTLRTVRLSLGSALRLLYQCDRSGQQLPTQSGLKQLLSKRPGLYCSLYGFVNFLNRQYALSLDARVDPEWFANVTHLARERCFRRVYAAVVNGGGSEQQWIRAAMGYLHGVKHLPSMLVYREQAEHEQPGFIVTYRGVDFWVPDARP